MKSQAGRSLGGWSAIAAVVALLSLPALPAQAQNCGKRQFNYWFCDGSGKLVQRCSECPNDEPGLTPYKRRKPCFKLATYRPPNITWSDGISPTPWSIYEGSRVPFVFGNAVAFWDGVEGDACSVGLEECGGCVRMVISDNTTDFENDETILKEDYYSVFYHDPSTCRWDCDPFYDGKEVIYINMTKTHMYDNNGKLKKVPYNTANGGVGHQHASGKGYEGVAMEDVMITAMAQFWGFAPQKGVGCGNTTATPWATDGKAPPSSSPRFNSTNRDAVICMFRRLYCPGEDPYCFARAVDENGKEVEAAPLDIAVTPNPSDGDVECIITTQLRGSASATIYDAAGGDVSGALDLAIEPGSRVYRLKSDLGAGAYMLVLSINGVNHVRGFVVLPK